MAADHTPGLQVQVIEIPKKRKSGVELLSPQANKRIKYANVGTASDSEQIETKRRTSSRTSKPSSRASQAVQARSVLESNSTLDVSRNVSQSTSPSTKSTSQTSISSQNTDVASTAASSILLDNGASLNPTSPTKDRPSIKQSKPQQTPNATIKPGKSRSPSISSNDEATRSSRRARKPTTKAKALANAGTKFYQSLRQTSDFVDDEHEVEAEEVVDNPLVEPEQHIPPQHAVIEPDEPIVVSVEKVPTRTSPRQSKVTTKAATTELNDGKKQDKPPHSGSKNIGKSAQTGSTIPGKPSKLRYPITSIGYDKETTSVLEKAPPKELEEHNDTEDDVQPYTGKGCSLTCAATDEKRLLLFASIAADDSSDEDEDEAEFELLLAAAQAKDGPLSKSVHTFETFCKCGLIEVANRGTKPSPGAGVTEKAVPNLTKGGDCVASISSSAADVSQSRTTAEIARTCDGMPMNPMVFLLRKLHDPPFATVNVKSIFNKGDCDFDNTLLYQAHEFWSSYDGNVTVSEAMQRLDAITPKQNEYFVKRAIALREFDPSHFDEAYYPSDDEHYDERVTYITQKYRQILIQQALTGMSDCYKYDLTPQLIATFDRAYAAREREEEFQFSLEFGPELELDLTAKSVLSTRRRKVLFNALPPLSKPSTKKKSAQPGFTAVDAGKDGPTTLSTRDPQPPDTSSELNRRDAGFGGTSFASLSAQERRDNKLGIDESDPPDISAMSSPPHGVTDEGGVPTVQNAATIAGGQRGSKRKSLPTQRMKILAANSATRSSKNNESDSTVARRSRAARHHAPPSVESPVKGAEDEDFNSVIQEPRPSKKIILKFRTPQTQF